MQMSTKRLKAKNLEPEAQNFGDSSFGDGEENAIASRNCSPHILIKKIQTYSPAL